ncbi:hypothetical protein POVWA2_037710 [Plasmodium ovale wallikeri]|uniref:Uncharacterized protein n=1 Tax=Plasmodium ovale wallikeri TaxID=864142 RepID=A0A1A8Z5Z8_PLAOA|nr:hypothetical protein POVWA1_038730 [Plasmodium ovale wallikeri]SBT39367.1 hypothetical protein POVWA2_037710 [Plasmodium ovale wallikeri]
MPHPKSSIFSAVKAETGKMQEAKQARSSLVQIEKGHQDKICIVAFQCCFLYIFLPQTQLHLQLPLDLLFFSDITRKEDIGEEPNWDYKQQTTLYFCIPSMMEK